jgi:uncharacterized protein with HEPN domain
VKRYTLVEIEVDPDEPSSAWAEPRGIREALVHWTPFRYSEIRVADVTDLVKDDLAAVRGDGREGFGVLFPLADAYERLS